jgi:hypothetical protein
LPEISRILHPTNEDVASGQIWPFATMPGAKHCNINHIKHFKNDFLDQKTFYSTCYVKIVAFFVLSNIQITIIITENYWNVCCYVSSDQTTPCFLQSVKEKFQHALAVIWADALQIYPHVLVRTGSGRNGLGLGFSVTYLFIKIGLGLFLNNTKGQANGQFPKPRPARARPFVVCSKSLSTFLLSRAEKIPSPTQARSIRARTSPSFNLDMTIKKWHGRLTAVGWSAVALPLEGHEVGQVVVEAHAVAGRVAPVMHLAAAEITSPTRNQHWKFKSQSYDHGVLKSSNQGPMLWF